NGETVQMWKSDGTTNPGPRTDWNAWHGDKAVSAGPAGIGYGNRFLQIDKFRIGEADDEGAWLYVNHINGDEKTVEAFNKDGTCHADRRRHGRIWSTGINERHVLWHCGNIQSKLGSCSGITTGPGFIQFGDWRLAAVDEEHFSISHRDLEEVKLGDRFIQFGKFWRLGEVDQQKLSISHSSGQTPMVFRDDGHLTAGPSTSDNLFSRKTTGGPKGITFGDRFVQIGSFRLGDVDGWRFSIAHVTTTNRIELFKGDGHRDNGDEAEWTTLGRNHVAGMGSTYDASGPSDLPLGRRWERFAVVDAGNGLVALHNARNNRFMKLSHTRVEGFEIVDAGNGMVGLHNPHHNRFILMDGNGHVKPSSQMDANELAPTTKRWERFYMVPVRNYLQPDTWVALRLGWNPTAGSFIQIEGDRVEGKLLDVNGLHDGHRWERFRVVDAGNGMVALHNHAWNRFVRMIWNGHQHLMTTSSPAPDTSVALPNGWEETMAFVPLSVNPDSNEIVLWHPGHSRRSADCTGLRDSR
ncbi:unnamed protein product, partial [Symbiodinium necroappetens]